MEEIMGQIEQDILYGDEPAATPPVLKIPAGTGVVRPGAVRPGAVVVSPTGVVTKNPNAPSEKSEVVQSVVDFLKKPAGPLPVFGWGLIGVGVVGVGGTVIYLATRRRY